MGEPLPKDIYEALLRSAKGWLLNNYVGGRKKLEPWGDHYAGLTCIYSFSFDGDAQKNLRRLAALTKSGVLLEKPRYRAGVGTRVFTAPRNVLDLIGAQAIKEHEADGYVVGVMTDKKEPQ